MTFQLVDDILADAGIINNTHIGRPQFQIGNILCHIAADTAMYLDDSADISAGRDVLVDRITLDIDKHCTKDNDSHFFGLLLMNLF